MNGSFDVFQALTVGLQTGGISFYNALWSILFARLLGGREARRLSGQQLLRGRA